MKKNIPMYDKYQVDELGNVYNKKRGNVLKPQLKGGKYLSVGVRHNEKGRHSQYVHRLVCLAFNGLPPSDRHEVDHKDFNRLNNASSNLEWVTPEENRKRQKDAGYLSGTKYSFSDSDKKNIVDMYESYPITYIANQYNVSSAVIKSLLVELGVFDGRSNRVIKDKFTNFSYDEQREIKRLYSEELVSNTEIADMFNVSPPTIVRITRNINYKDCRGKVFSESYESGNSIEFISDKYQISVGAVKRIIIKYGELRSEDIYVKPYGIADKDEFLSLVEKRYTLKMLTEYYNCGDGAVETAIKRFGARLNGLDKRNRKYDYKELYEMNKTMPQWKIAEKLGTSQSNIAIKISKYKKENGIGGHGNKTKKPE